MGISNRDIEIVVEMVKIAERTAKISGRPIHEEVRSILQNALSLNEAKKERAAEKPPEGIH